jgi:mannose-6-phosphate isomerase
MFHSLISFAPLYQTRVWGGRRLESLFGRSLPKAEVPYGESWEISDREHEQSIATLSDGTHISLHELWTKHREAVFGAELLQESSSRYPLLMKILDACDDLSIQVHPPADVVPELGGDPKTEMWLVVHAEPGARIYAGIREGVTREAFEQLIANGTVAEGVQVLEPKAGDCLFIPSGLVHAIGAGLVIYEVQQNSDTTYRVFDWNRVGLDGQPRALHVQESLRSIDFASPPPTFQQTDVDGRLVICEYFEIREGRSKAGESTTLGQPGEHLCIALISGSLGAGSRSFGAGDFALVPACLSATEREIQTSVAAHWLEIRIPESRG